MSHKADTIPGRACGKAVVPHAGGIPWIKIGRPYSANLMSRYWHPRPGLADEQLAPGDVVGHILDIVDPHVFHEERPAGVQV